MADTITVAGHKVNKWVAYGGIGVLVVGGVLIFRSRSASSSAAGGAASTTASGSIDPATGLPYSQDNQVDPATGMTYAAEAAQYGSVSAADSAVSGGYGAGGYGGYGGYSGLGYGYPGGYNGGGTNTGTGGYTDNAQWAQAVEAGLTGLGYDPQVIGAAIGKYLAKLPLTADQVTIVQTAVAEYGNPPVGTFAIIPAGGGHTTQNVPVPNVVGQSAGEAHNVIVAAQLTPHEDSASIRPNWTVTSQSPKAGTQVSPGSQVSYQAKAPAGGGGGGGGGQGHAGQVQVPNVVGQSQANAFESLADAGLHATGSRVVRGKVLHVTAQNPRAGTWVNRGSTVHLTSK